jgi:hypothetical protein
MRALLLRRTAFLAVLVTGLALTASAVHGLSGMDHELELAAVSQQQHQQQQQQQPTFVSERHDGCGRDDERFDEPPRRI